MLHRRTPIRSHAHVILSDSDDLAAPCYLLCSLANCTKSNSIIDTDTGQALKCQHLSRGPNKGVFIYAYTNDLGRLAKGVGTRMPTGNNTIYFVAPSSFPYGRKVTYGRLVATLRPHK